MCSQCSKKLTKAKNIFFVEEEVGRIFCSEACISKFFSPEIERLEKEYFQYLNPTDLSNTERENLSHLRWMTLQEPDEAWFEKTEEGDHRFTLISEFKPGKKKIWCVCICLFLRGEPSFLYLSFPTSNSAMAGLYRRGERINPEDIGKMGVNRPPPAAPTDSLADEWTEDETIRAQLKKERRPNDIPLAEFSVYEPCLEETLKNPDEVWSVHNKPQRSPMLYHFVRFYSDREPSVWYIVIARETKDQEQIEILDAFPTRDPELVDCYRQGTQEVGPSNSVGKARMVH